MFETCGVVPWLVMMNTTPECCLTNNQFEISTTAVFRDLLTDKDFVEVTLVCQVDKQAKAHKAILSSCSPFFQKNIYKQPTLTDALLPKWCQF